MIPLLADENFNGVIVRALFRRAPKIDLVRVQDIGLTGSDDPTVLAWAADHGRVLVTHDVSTITRYAYERVDVGLSMPGVIEVSRRVSIGTAIEDLLLIAELSKIGEWEAKVIYLPL